MYDTMKQILPYLEYIHLKTFLGILVAFIFYIIARAISHAIRRIPAVKRQHNRQVLEFIAKTVKFIIILLGIIVMLGSWGIDVSALIAGLGITGFALGFAMQDALSSMLAGILVLLYKPFEIGDRIEIAGIEGEIISIDMRYTTIRFDHKRHLIPNSKLLSEKITIVDGD